MNIGRIKVSVLVVGTILLSVFGILLQSPAKAVEGLLYPRDVISNNVLGAYAEHAIRFGLPVNAEPITPTDYILIDMPFFTNLVAANSITGSYEGTPVYTVVGSRMRVTGISVLPGNFINIYGLKANNPHEYDWFDVYIRISSDIDGQVIRNEAHVIATITTGTVTVTAVVEANVGTLRITGSAPPGMFITYTEGGTVIGTSTADDTGMFTQVFPGMKPEIHTILLFGVDQAGRTTPSTTIEVFTRPYALTTVSGIIMPPTLALSSSAINQGDPVTVSGNAIPDRKVIIFSEPPLNSYEVYADIAGQYSFTISDTAGLDFGDHKVYAFVQDEFGGQSLMSHSAFFKVVDSSSGNEGEPPTWDISQGDLNGDTGVNLADFAILLYYWGSTRPEADINGDGLVNLADFSIMMFYWEG